MNKTPENTYPKMLNQPPPAKVEALIALYNECQYAELENRARALTELHPDSGLFWKLLSISLHMQGKDPLFALQKTAYLLPEDAGVHNNLGNVLKNLGQLEDAVASFRRALKLKPDFAMVHFNLGNTLKELGHLESAVTSYRRALEIEPNNVEVHCNLGDVLKERHQLNSAVACYRHALEIEPNYAEVHNKLGLALEDLDQLDGAAASYRRALELKPNFAEAHNNLGISLQTLGQLDAALTSYRKAVELKPDFAEAHGNMGVALNDLKQLEAALASYNKAIAIKPDYAFLYGDRLHTKMYLCDWANIEKEFNVLITRIAHNEKAAQPFPVLAITDNLSIQRQATEIWIKDIHPINLSLGNITKRSRRDKIRIGYYSADYRNHATTYLMAELFEQHNKNNFELIAFSFGSDASDEMRKRAIAAFDQFIDVRNQSDKDVALLSRNMGIDIAVDLKGYTRFSRPGIFSYKAAPIQVNYIGYPGTMGTEYIDYVIADKTLIPEASQQHFSEKVAYLPNSYQVNDSKRLISDKRFTRAELGLPEDAFVFCCFNNNYKITPYTFDGWMRILQKAEGSVLWLLEDNPTVANNLAKEAEARGVIKERLIFAKRLPLPEHLARHRAADLFLDTFPCNAHTTASDALWAGLPVLTRIGEAFASRVAASLLNAVHLSELITQTQAEYEALAIELALHPEKLEAIKVKLENNRLAAPLFDCKLYTKHIEDAYTQMYERYHAGLLPEHIYVD